MTKRSGEAVEFDPRFDPAFQPGYRPPEREHRDSEAVTSATTGAATPDRASMIRSAGSNAGAAPAPESRIRAASGAGVVVTPVGGGDGGGGTEDDGARAGAGGDVAGSGAAGGADLALGAPAEPQHRNPFVLALWAISALFLLVGIGIVRWAFTLLEELQTTQNPDQADWQLSYMLQQSGPQVIMLGLAAATLTVFLHAQTWHRRRQ